MHCSELHFQTAGRAVGPWTSRVQTHEWRRRPGRVRDRGAGAGEARASRKHAPKTMRASETKALRAMRSRATLVALAAPRRAANAGQVRLIESESDSSARTDWTENRKACSVGSPSVVTGRGRSFTGLVTTSAKGTQGWGEDKICGSDRSPPVVSRGAWGEEKSWEGSGSPRLCRSRAPPRPVVRMPPPLLGRLGSGEGLVRRYATRPGRRQ